MRKIKLTKSKYAIVDDDYFEYLNQWKWYCNFYDYAVREIGGSKNKKRIYMHRLVNNTPENYLTDHINRNRLDNRKINLRTVNPTASILNRGINKNNTSGHKGIIWRKDTKSWSARIKTNYKEIYLGCYKDIKEAIKARKKAELIYHSI
jgi:hypothetical protein